MTTSAGDRGDKAARGEAKGDSKRRCALTESFATVCTLPSGYQLQAHSWSGITAVFGVRSKAVQNPELRRNGSWTFVLRALDRRPTCREFPEDGRNTHPRLQIVARRIAALYRSRMYSFHPSFSLPCHGQRPSISTVSETLRKVLIKTMKARTRTFSSVGSTATVPTNSAATRSSRPSSIARPRRRRKW